MYVLLLCVLFIGVKCEKPNIILIIADDMGRNDVSFYGSNEIPTPNIDALACNGIMLDKFYTQPSCTPSRTALLTGSYPIKNGMQGTPIRGGEDRGLLKNATILPKLFQKLGYSTHLVGKWHVGASKTEHLPTNNGFDTHFGYWNGFIGAQDHFMTQTSSNLDGELNGFDLHENLTPARGYDQKYATDIFTDRAVKIIENHTKKDSLFLILSHLIPHASGRYGNITAEVPDEAKMNETLAYIKDPERRKYAAIVKILDDSVGKIMSTLSERDLLKNSIVMFISDNGAQTIGVPHVNYGSNWPLRGLKLTNFEGGVRGTGIIFSPLLAHKQYIYKHLFHISDILPTFYTAAGGSVEKLVHLDGKNQWDSLSHNRKSKRDDILINIDETTQDSALVTDKYKIIYVNASNPQNYQDYYGSSGRTENVPKFNATSVLTSPTNLAIKNLNLKPALTKETIVNLRENAMITCKPHKNPEECNGFCLFNLQKDPCESENLAGKISYAPVLWELKARLYSFYKVLVPQQNPNHVIDIAADPAKFNNTWTPWLSAQECS